MRVQILSDLHIEYPGNTLPTVCPDADVVVFAGDLAPVRTNRIGEVMRTWRYPDLLYVPGNHEWYGSEIDSARLELARQCRDHGVELLDPGVVDVDDVRFVGATLWTDFRLEGREGVRQQVARGDVARLDAAVALARLGVASRTGAIPVDGGELREAVRAVRLDRQHVVGAVRLDDAARGVTGRVQGVEREHAAAHVDVLE